MKPYHFQLLRRSLRSMLSRRCSFYQHVNSNIYIPPCVNDHMSVHVILSVHAPGDVIQNLGLSILPLICRLRPFRAAERRASESGLTRNRTTNLSRHVLCSTCGQGVLTMFTRRPSAVSFSVSTHTIPWSQFATNKVQCLAILDTMSKAIGSWPTLISLLPVHSNPCFIIWRVPCPKLVANCISQKTPVTGIYSTVEYFIQSTSF